MQVLNIFHVLIAISLVAFILIQKGQGATAGAAFGSGASGTVFGARGAGNFLSRTTWVLAALFCTISLTMAVMVSRTSNLPEDNLGVLGSTQPAPAADSSTESSVISVGSDEQVGSDLPSFDPAAEGMNSSVADDLPAIDSAANEALDNAVTEEVQAAEDGLSGDGSDSDDY